MCRRPPTPQEIAATYFFADRFAAQTGDAVVFYQSLSVTEQQHIEQLCRALSESMAEHTGPRCPKNCDVSMRPELIRRGDQGGHYVFACYGCGGEFCWPPESVAVS